MRDWIVIFGIALLVAVIGFWALRRRPDAAGSEAVQQAGASGASAQSAAPVAVSPAPASGPPLAMLYFESAPGKVAVLRSEIVIGRHSEDDIRVPDVRVSRHHAKIVAKRDGGFEIHNLTAVRSEPNPMFINGEAREHGDIADGDVVSLGGVNFTFRLAA